MAIKLGSIKFLFVWGFLQAACSQVTPGSGNAVFGDLSPHTRAQQHLEHPRAESHSGNPQLSIQHCQQQLWHPEITQHPGPSAAGAWKCQIILGKQQFPGKHQPARVPSEDFLEKHHKGTKCRSGSASQGSFYSVVKFHVNQKVLAMRICFHLRTTLLFTKMGQCR